MVTVYKDGIYKVIQKERIDEYTSKGYKLEAPKQPKEKKTKVEE